MNEEILEEFARLYNYQSALAKIFDNGLSSKYNVSELHCLELIGIEENINGKELSLQLKLTKGAISKITKKLLNNGLIETYNLKDNKKEKYYKLTDNGKLIFKQHEETHQAWKIRDAQFLENIDKTKRKVVFDFLIEFNGYLEKIIEEEEI